MTYIWLRFELRFGVAAVGGREVEHEMLMAVAGGRDEATADVRVLVDAGLLLPARALDGDDAYSFRHALVQEAVYETLPGWTEDLVEDLTEIYEEDVFALQRMPGIQMIAP